MTLEISRKSFFRLGLGLAAAATGGAVASAAPAKKAEPVPTKPVRTLIKGADVMTGEKGKPDLLAHDVLIEGGKIVAVEKAIPAAGAEVVDGAGKVLTPGFTDGFRHNWETYANGRILKTNNTYPRYYDSWVGIAPYYMTPEDYYASEYIGGLEAINSGYTNVINFASAHYTKERYEAGVKGFKASGVGGIFCWTVENERIGKPQLGLESMMKAIAAPKTDATYALAEQIRDAHFSDDPAADLQFGFSTMGSVGQSPEELTRHFGRMRALKPRLIIEHYTRSPVLPPAGAVQTLTQMYEMGLFKPDYMISHALTLTDDELILMAKSGVSTASAPLVEMSYDRKEACIHGRAHKFGVPAAMGFDAPVEAVRDPFEMMRMAFAVLFKTQDSWAIADTLGSEDILAFKTRTGAEASNRLDVCGTITPGKRADLVLIDISGPMVPTNGVLADKIVNFCALSDIDSVWVGGVRRKKAGKMIGIDWAALKAQRAEIDARVWKAMGSPRWGVQPSWV